MFDTSCIVGDNCNESSFFHKSLMISFSDVKSTAFSLGHGLYEVLKLFVGSSSALQVDL
jgi:hypothetical protein